MNYIGKPNQNLICLNDICVIYISDQQKNILRIQPNEEVHSKFGSIKAMDLLHKPYGVRYECKKGWVLPLKLTCESWRQLLPHRTQILYQADISMILLQLDIKPNSIIVESGTGSGSLSHAILRACRPNGFLYTFDINESRAKSAQDEFVEHGYGQNVKVTCRNVCELGFGNELSGKADACMLDLPQTWEAIESAYEVLKPDGSKLCTFSPCIEQVQQNVAKMTELKMKDIVTLETLLRPFEVKTQELCMWDDQILDGLTEIDRKRFENLKDKLNLAKKPKTSSSPPKDQELSAPDVEFQQNDSTSSPKDDDLLSPLQKALTDPKAPFNPGMLPKKSHTFARQLLETTSHSGFLTFATRRS